MHTRGPPTPRHAAHTLCLTGSFAPSSTADSDIEQQQQQQPQQPQRETVMLDVKGMMCGGCSAAVKSILLQQPGVQGAAVNLITHAAAVTVACVRRGLLHACMCVCVWGGQVCVVVWCHVGGVSRRG
jgi:copper chaperone CopZ